jgi:3-hydroxyisobutyrate dehydrogenase
VDGRNGMKPAIGFIGIGNMGWPMAARLVGAGFAVSVQDSKAGVADAFAREIGGSAAADFPEFVAGSDVLITILPTSAVVDHVLGLALPSIRPGTVVVEMTSGIPSITRALADRIAGQGAVLIDAPVSGGVARAKTGELAIMVGGEDAVVERVRPILDALGTSILRTGGVGSGQAMKALNNLVSAGGFLIGVEALLMGQRFGLDPAVMVDVLNASTGMNNSTQKKFNQFVLSRAFNSGFGLDLMVKDLSIALEVARDTTTPAPFAALCRELWASAAALLGPGQDHTAVAKFSERLAGTELGAPKT